MATVVDSVTTHVENLTLHDQGKKKGVAKESEEVARVPAEAVAADDHSHGVCAICLDKIVLQETALVKGCEHAYCVACILHWASYSGNPKCPQCKYPFDVLSVHRSLDGSIHDYMFEESLCLLLRATWFKPLDVDQHVDLSDELEELGLYQYYQYNYAYEDEDDDTDEDYLPVSSSLRIGNRRWGVNGYVKSGRQQARPTNRSIIQDSGAGSSREVKKSEPNRAVMERRAKRALKREAADRAVSEKHHQRLLRLGRK
ncbi:hypothetical protein Droror1_Dr00025136 [Drosera rotundifolia]